MSSHALSAADPYERWQVPVLDTNMAYIDTGSGEPVVFLHGNPTSFTQFLLMSFFLLTEEIFLSRKTS